ncbi:Hypothetical protein, putative [Bodo saltans]|uniref:Uncharacterized protein n=1 Tax=Bodo saltans TaxID=75058 RepID=A0A0S4J3L9_BODSA|nr:Hypothetical protein, putative [Bodo saltans]|eukprot:CUG08378.1 Hypothetical protein, putative [Bodo saltans]
MAITPTTAPLASSSDFDAEFADNEPGPRPACLTPTPAKIGTPFPCTTRVTKYNSHEFWNWPQAENLRRATLLAPILKGCKGIEPMGATPQERNTTSLRVIGCSGYSGTWTRCWIVPMTNTTTKDGSLVPTCKAGDHYDVRIQSSHTKIAIDRVIDLDNGIYEMQFYVRFASLFYHITIDKVMLHQVMPLGYNDLRITLGNGSMVGFAKTKAWSDKRPPGVPVEATPAWPLFTETFRPLNSLGVDVVPLPQRCDEVYDADRFRFGAWLRLRECDNVHCVGKLSGRASLEGWLWTSDVCMMKMHSPKELEALVRRAWIVGWGGSTMKQPLSNFMEYYLEKPIFSVFMTQLDSLKKKRKRPGFFSYRQWDVTPFPTTRVSMQWGGCPSIMAGPNGCTFQVGLGSWSKIANLVGTPAAVDAKNETPSFPTALLMDMTVWRYPQDDDVAYLRTVDDLFKNIDGWVKVSKRPRPMMTWVTTPSGGNSNRGYRAAGAPTGVTSGRNFDWLHEDHMMSAVRSCGNLVHISRHQITLPLHFGIEWVHFGLHYGASEGMCNTGP